ncbi:MAG: cation-translocating P-type ATPase [Phenylobacterium sp.]|jgi:Ca2+-transporting ATPase|uniref:cation-translocating P-type ATPase n=1 Tax=Phenylobacterium sp. TaxID=1871053 RepID=UPI002A35E061|nr:cation-translocating P-type ATPase [Phenylobacterium sp.]MDX9999425.1 cation-translocating P-type ATPase [Phenylobacterium sp.]
MDPRTAAGLTSDEAARRLAEVGPNEMPSDGGRSVWRIIRETMREPMFLLLAGAALLYLLLGDLGEGLFLVAGAAASIGLVIVQEARSERALAALRELAQPTARVLRDGAETQIPVRELVPDDLLLIGEGERMPADGRLVAGEVLSVDESALTGESAPVSREPAGDDQSISDAEPGVEGGPHLFAGTMVVRGQGMVRVTRTGARSALGQIGASLAAIASEPTPLQRTAGKIVGLLGVFALAFCVLVAVAYGTATDDWVAGALAGITLAISLIPEEFPMVLAVFLAFGAWRLATRQVLARRSAVIETLGAATFLCVDKTGTLTENRMRVAHLLADGEEVEAEPQRLREGPHAELLSCARLASAVRPVDPMDKAVHALWRSASSGAELPAPEPERSWPLRSDFMAVVQLWRPTCDGRWLAAAKGAPEAIFRLCRLPADEVERLHAVIHAWAGQGLRVLGVASARGEGAACDEPLAGDFAFAGLVGFLDPLRPDVPAALQEARGAGIQVVMITGDHPATALAIARSAGIDVEAGALTGAELAAVSREELAERMKRVRVFARIQPEQKLRIIEVLKAAGEVVAMTGDGVNDAPALQAAHIGVAMGRKGTDVAREASDLVLLDDSFPSIVAGVRLGRRIFSNLRRALTFVTAIHVPIAGLALAPILLGLPPLLFPMHVVLLELVIDPTCALVFEAEPSERGAMRRPPRRRDEPLFGVRQVAFAALQGLGILAATLGFYAWALEAAPEASARGGAYLALVIGAMALALTDSAATGKLFAPHRRIFWAIAGAIGLVLTVIFAVPAASDLFDVARPTPQVLLLALAAGLLGGGWSGLFRLARAAATSAGLTPRHSG